LEALVNRYARKIIVTDPDIHNLKRFLEAQEGTFAVALQELINGKKQSHWMWYIFPQVEGLGHSSIAQRYAIQSKEEAEAYLKHKVLGDRLHQCTAALLTHKDKRIIDIMGYPDNLKLCSSMTLFSTISAPGNIFSRVINQFFAGEADKRTFKFLNA
jgi:uncharacterized protein (DUF1810 family)